MNIQGLARGTPRGRCTDALEDTFGNTGSNALEVVVAKASYGTQADSITTSVEASGHTRRVDKAE